MPCERVTFPGGVEMTVCSRGRRRKPCSAAGCYRDAVLECDFRLGGRKTGKTCDRALCANHATRMGQDAHDTIDYCPAHATEARGGRGQLALPGAR